MNSVIDSLRPAMNSVIDTLRPALGSVAPTAVAAALSLGSIAPLGLASVGCAAPTGDDQDAVLAAGEAIDRTTQALMVGDLKALAGTYGEDCKDRSGSWNLQLSGPEVANPLSVVKNNSECELTLTHVVADSTYPLEKPMKLKTSFGAPTKVGSGPSGFWVNAKLDSTDMSKNFKVTMLFAESPGAVSSAVNTGYTSVGASGEVGKVPAPTYSLDTSAFAVQVDAHSVVTSASGSVSLVAGDVAGTSYAIDTGTLSVAPSYEEVAAFFAGAAVTPIAGASTNIPASAFSLVGASLESGAARTIVVRGGTPDLPTYQLIRFSMAPPSPSNDASKGTAPKK